MTSHPLFARLYDPMMALPERTVLSSHRAHLAEGLSGRVLDIGAGTGAMFPHVADTDCSVTAVEPDPHMRQQAEKRASSVDADITIIDAQAESLPFPNDSFDAATAVFVFCTIADVERGMDELARVLRPGGEFRFLEHVRARGALGVAHDALTPCWSCAAGGCNLDRRTGDRFQRDDRFELVKYDRFETGLTRALPLVRGRLERHRDPLRARLL